MYLFGLLLFLGSSAIPVRQLQAQEHAIWLDSLYSVLKTDLESLTSKQEAYFSTAQAYAWNLGLLEFEASDSVSLGISATGDGFIAIATHEALGSNLGCTVYLGAVEPPVFPIKPPAPGKIACTSGGPHLPPVDLNPDPSAGPTFTPYDVAPEVTNPEEVQRALTRQYPPLLRDAGIGGTVQIWIFIDGFGKVRRTLLDSSSGHRALDNAALQIAEIIQFNPALNQNRAVPVWISYPITFRIRRLPRHHPFP